MTVSSSATGFHLFDAANAAEESDWLQLWTQWPNREVSTHPAYSRLFAQGTDRVLCAAQIDASGGGILYPFILRLIEPLDGLDQWGDIVSPYGYGGPHAWGSQDMDSLAEQFWSSFDGWARDHNIVTEFIRFTLFPETLAPYPGVKVTRSNNIVVSLEADEEALWMSFEHKVRKNVKKAERNGVTVIIEESGELLDDFLRIYLGTMERREAASGFYFPREFFEAINAELQGQFAYFHAMLDGTVISTELVLVSADSVYSFLGGTDETAFDLRPNDLLKFEVMKWARSRGKSRFVLGGGAAPGDGIERYKKAFAPNGVVQFQSGQRVLRPDLEQLLVARRRSEFFGAEQPWPDESEYFPKYRMPL